ncbi:uncharacterized protein ISCGN_021849 [Ixodes scapularis]
MVLAAADSPTLDHLAKVVWEGEGVWGVGRGGIASVDSSRRDLHCSDNFRRLSRRGVLDGIKTNIDTLFKLTGPDGKILKVKERVGDLKPLYDVFHAFVDALCPGLVGPVNAFWLSITVYLLLSIPAIIMALKLAAVYSKVKAPGEVPVATDELMSQPLMPKGMHAVPPRRSHDEETSQLPKASEDFLSSGWHATIPSTTTFSHMRSTESGIRSSA